jgi:hypothetical protein
MTKHAMICRRVSIACVVLVAISLVGGRALADLPQPGDLVFGLSTNNAATTLELVRGPAVAGGGVSLPSPYTQTAFIQSLRFDNTGGINHNAAGNLIGLNFGAFAVGGQIYSFGTNTTDPAPAGVLIADLQGVGGTFTQPLNRDPQTRLFGVSISPENNRIAAMGYDWGEILVWDYTPGDTTGNGGSTSNARRTDAGDFPNLYIDDSQGTTWIDNNTVVSLASNGTLFEVDATTMDITTYNVASLLDTGAVSSVYFNDQVSPYLWAVHNNFSDSVSTSTLLVLDPANSYSVVANVDFSTSSDSFREIAFDADGNLYISTFGSQIQLIAGAALDPANIADNSSVLWYDSPTNASFSGIDIGFGAAAPATPGDFNGDSVVDAADYTLWRDNLGAADESAIGNNGDGGGIDQSDYELWRLNFGNNYASGSLGSGNTVVPEPQSLLVCAALAGIWCCARRLSLLAR